MRKKYLQERDNLKNLSEFTYGLGISAPIEVTSQLIESWYDELPGTWRTRHARICGLNRFFNYLTTSGCVSENPIPKSLLATRRGVPRSKPPFTFSLDQITAILRELGTQPANQVTPWRPQTCEMMGVLQYACGLRHGELRRIRLHDVDMQRRTVLVDRTKFYKSRCLPFGDRVEERLRKFIELRSGILPPVHDSQPLFVSRWRTPLCDSVYGDAFRRAMQALAITTPQGDLPRPHDLRHSFAVHRLARWYREGVDVQSRLPWLSTFLGHVDIQSTEVYLTITTELLEQASARFFAGFGCDVPQGEKYA